MGVKVTLNKISDNGLTSAVRIFEKGEKWTYFNNSGTRTLLIMAALTEKTRSFIAEFAADTVESVEFV